MSYSNRAHVSKAAPDKVLHLVFDGPNGYDLPHITPVSKETSNLFRISVDAVGTINHSSGCRDYIFFLKQYKKNPNLILTCFYLHIVQHLETTGSHPPVLWLQADNCIKENKNRWMLGFCEWLVHKGLFQEIMISMLPPGHTHIDVDQMFSTFSKWLDTHSIHSLSDLLSSVDSAYRGDSTKPTAFFLPTVYNFIGFFAPFMRDLGGLNTAHVFLICKQPNGLVGIKVKKWHSVDSKWLGADSNPNDWFSCFNKGQYPPGFPGEVAPLPLEDNMTEDILSKWRKWLRPSAVAEWEQFIQSVSIPVQLRFAPSVNLWDFAKVLAPYFMNFCFFLC